MPKAGKDMGRWGIGYYNCCVGLEKEESKNDFGSLKI